jgi:hypothetical protein
MFFLMPFGPPIPDHVEEISEMRWTATAGFGLS